MVALFEPQHEVYETLRDAQKILGAQVGHPGRLQRMHRADCHPLLLCNICQMSLALCWMQRCALFPWHLLHVLTGQ